MRILLPKFHRHTHELTGNTSVAKNMNSKRTVVNRGKGRNNEVSTVLVFTSQNIHFPLCLFLSFSVT